MFYGEEFVVFEECDGWCWGFFCVDGYVGWVEVRVLSGEIFKVDYKIMVL